MIESDKTCAQSCMPHFNDESVVRPAWLRLSKLPSIQGEAVLISHVGRSGLAMVLPRGANVFASVAHCHHEELAFLGSQVADNHDTEWPASLRAADGGESVSPRLISGSIRK